MKRIILLISALLLCLVLASCDSTESESDNTTTPLSSNVEETPNTDDPSNTTEAPQPTETPFYSETDAPTPTETEADTEPIEDTTPVCDLISIDKIEFGMSFNEVLDILGKPHDTQFTVKYYWFAENDILFCVTTFEKNNETLVYRTLKQKIIQPDKIDFITVGMTCKEIEEYLDSEGELIGSGAIIYRWRISDGRSLKIHFLSNGSMENSTAEKISVE